MRRRSRGRGVDCDTAARRGVSRHPDAGLERSGSGRATGTGAGAAARVRHRLRRACDQGVRPERRRLSSEALRQGSAAQVAGASARASRRGARGKRDGHSHCARADRLAPSGCWYRRAKQLQLIDASSIHWLEADDNYVHVHTAQTRYMLRRTLSDLLTQLGSNFRRIHKSAAVNITEVKIPVAPLQGRPRSALAQRRGAAPEPALQGRVVR